MNLWIYWIIIIVILAIIEALSNSFVSIWFGASALVCLILSFFSDNMFLQLAIFIVLGLVLLFTTRKKILAYINPSKEKPKAKKATKKNTKVTKNNKKK